MAERRGYLEMGDHSYGSPITHVYEGDTTRVRIGKFTALARGVSFYVGAMHRTDWVTAYPFRGRFGLADPHSDGHPPASRGDINIGNDVWVASGATILSGVSVGDGAVIGARSVVSRDVRPYSVVAGNPAREVRLRFDQGQIEALLRIAWWDWPTEAILARVDELCSPQLDAFIASYDPRRPPAT